MILYLLLAIGTVIFTHELAHMLVAISVGIKVEAFSIGFGKPYLEKEIWGIKFRISPWILGGYTKLEGEGKDERWLYNTYSKKVAVILAGAVINLLTVIICYLIMYGSIIKGISIDGDFIFSVFSKNFANIVIYVDFIKSNPFLTQLSWVSLLATITSLLPILPLDGSYVFLFLCENFFKSKLEYIKFHKKIIKISYFLLGLLHLILLYIVIV